MSEDKEIPNPPAFPVHGGGHIEDDPRNHTLGGGMTMRDYFAASYQLSDDCLSLNWAKQLMNSDPPKGFYENMIWWQDAEAKFRYMKADAMLKERSKH